MKFQWTHIPIKKARGIITGYNIYLRESVSGDRAPEQTQHPVANSNTTQICGLKAFTNYQASIKGFTKFGEGTIEGLQTWITVKTDENGNFNFFMLFSEV